MTKKKKGIIAITIILVLICIVCVVIGLKKDRHNNGKGLFNSDNEIAEKCIDDLKIALEDMKKMSVDQDSHIYYMPGFGYEMSIEQLEGDGFSYAGIGSYKDIANNINLKVSSLVEYNIEDVSINDDTAEVKLRMNSPDLYSELSKVASEMDEYDLEKLLNAIDGRINSEIQQKEYVINVKLKLIGDDWYLIPSGELSNAFSGGINEYYYSMGKEIVEGLVEENND